jgi:hypothetical protein
MMICDELSKLLGISCHHLADDIAVVDTAFAYKDGDPVQLFIEKIGPQVRFFDDGGTLLHFLGRGMSLDGKKIKFIKAIAEPHGVALNVNGELEIWTSQNDAPGAFVRYLATIVGIIDWEEKHIGASTDISLLVEEIGLCLRAWRPELAIQSEPEYTGISGQKFKLDYFFDEFGVIGVTPHHSSVGSALRKLIDIKAKAENSDLKILAIMDDRLDPESAKKEGLVMESIAKVWKMTSLEQQSKISRSMN